LSQWIFVTLLFSALASAGALVGQYTDTMGRTHGFLAVPLTGSNHWITLACDALFAKLG
jgi:hypothetical protein